MVGNLFAKPKTFHIQCALLLLEYERIPALEKRTRKLNVSLPTKCATFLPKVQDACSNKYTETITVLLRNKALESEGKHKETNALKKHREPQKNYIIFQVLRALN